VKKYLCFFYFLTLFPCAAQGAAQVDLSKKLAVLKVGMSGKCAQIQQNQWKNVVKKMIIKKGIPFEVLKTPRNRKEFLALIKDAEKKKARLILLMMCGPARIHQKKVYKHAIFLFFIKNEDKNAFSIYAQSRTTKTIKDVKKRLSVILDHGKRFLESRYVPKRFFKNESRGKKLDTAFNLGLSAISTYDFMYKTKGRLAFGVAGDIDFVRRYRLSLAVHGGFPLSLPSLNIFVSVSGAYALLHKKWNVFSFWIVPIGYEARLLFSGSSLKGHEHRIPLGIDLELHVLRLFKVNKPDLRFAVGGRYSIGFAFGKSKSRFSYSEILFNAGLKLAL